MKRLQTCQRSKLEVEKMPTRPDSKLMRPGPADMSSDIFVASHPHLKGLIHICLQTKGQGHGMAFSMCHIGSKYPYFIPYRSLC